MKQCIEDMREKEVISISDGTRIGFVSDIEIDTVTASLTALIVYGKPKLFGLLGREEDVIVPWQNVKLIGDDTVLVDYRIEYKERKKRGILSNIIEIK
ncbi:MAG: YlmC/YmxH family sporulation protein [Ruminococcaceae bacterium]|nr:YlmC/YmxH family sporulation protein [Oscillospiraceae bacterium]